MDDQSDRIHDARDTYHTYCGHESQSLPGYSQTIV